MSRTRIGIVLTLGILIGWPLNVRAQQPAPSSSASPGSSSAAPGSKPTPSASQQSAKASQQPKASPSASPGAQVPQTNLPDMSITATRISQPLSQLGMTVTVVDKQQIQDQKIQQTSDALREVPGVQVTQSGGPGTETDVSIRGSSSSQVLTLLDGVEVNTGGSGEFDYANLNTANASRIEVIRGAGGSLYGSSAIGGVINQITEEGTGAPKFSLLSDGGNWDTERQIATASGALDRLGYSGSVSYYSTSGFQPINSDNDNLSLTSRLDYHLTDDTVLRAFARYTFADVGLSEFSNDDPGNPLDPTAHQRTEFMLYKGEIDSHLTDKLLVRMFGSFVRDEVRINKIPSAAPLTNGESDDIPDEIWGTNLEAVYTWCRGFDTLAGFDFKYRWGRDGDNSTFPGTPPSITVFTADREEYAGYFQQQGRFFDGHLLVTGGFRVDGNSQFGKEVSPAWSVALPFDEYGVTLRGSYAEGFQAPTFDELYFPGFGNPDLKATTSSEYDGGIEKRFGEFASITTTYFSRRIHDLVVDAPCKFNPATCEFDFQPKNIGRQDMQGVEVVPAIYPIKGLSLSGSFTALDSTHRPLIAGLQPIRVPKHSATAVAQYKTQDIFARGDQFISALSYQFVGDREDLQTQSPFGDENHGSYQLFNLTLSYKLGEGFVPYLNHEEAFVRIQNLFDRHYSQDFGFPAPPINYEAGIKVGF
jgi:vitamin B12 transporter